VQIVCSHTGYFLLSIEEFYMITAKHTEKLEKSAMRLTVTVEKDFVQKKYNEVLNEYCKKARIDGFRVGKVPPKVFENKYGNEIKMDAFQKIIEAAMDEAWKDESIAKPLPYAHPDLDEDPDFSLDKDFTFKIKYDVYPEFALPNTSNITIEVPQCSISKEDEQEEIEELRQRNAVIQDVKDDAKASKGMLATVNYSELDESGNVVPGTSSQDFVFEIGSGQNIYKFDEEIIGMKKGEEKVITKTYPADFEYPELAGKSKTIKVALTRLREKILPDLDDEFAQDVSEKYKTLADLKNDINTKLARELDDLVKAKKEQALLDELIARTTIEVPETMIQSSLSMRLEQMAYRFGLNSFDQLKSLFASMGKDIKDLFNEWRPDVEKNLKKDLLIQKFLEEKKYEISDEDLNAEYAKIAEETSRTVDEVKKQYEKPEYQEYLKEHLLQERLFNELLAQVTVKKGAKTTFKELRKQ